MTVQPLYDEQGKIRGYQARGRMGRRNFKRHFTTKKAAEAFDLKMRNEKETQRSGGLVVDHSRGLMTVREFAEGWKARRTAIATTTQSSVAISLNRLYSFVGLDGSTVGDMPLRDVETADMDAFIQWLVSVKSEDGKARFSGETSRVTWVYVKALFAAACHWARIPNPCLDPTKPGKMLKLPRSSRPTPKIEVPTFEEIEAITANLPPIVAAYAWLGARTGLRPGELLGLDLANIEPFNVRLRAVDNEPTTGTVHVRQQISTRSVTAILPNLKTGKSRRSVQIGAGTVALILEHLRANNRHAAEGGLLFQTEQGNTMGHHYVYRYWRRALVDAGITRRVRLHDMRHYFASALIDAGASVIAVSEALGHSSTRETLDTYGHLFPNWQEKVRDTLELRIAEDRAKALKLAVNADWLGPDEEPTWPRPSDSH